MSFIDKFNYNRNELATTQTVGESSSLSNPPDHGYSLFNLNGNEHQYVVDVVDVTTNTTGSYTATDLKDGTLEAAINDIGVVSKFYDQFGGKHATGVNNDTGEMPFIITGGNFIQLGGKPAMIFRSGDRNAYLSIKAPGASSSNNSSHIVGVDGIEAFATVSLEENATSNSAPYHNSYIFGENFGFAISDYALGFIRDGSNNRLTLYVERGTANSFARGSVAADTDATKHGYAYTGEVVTLGERYTINSFAKFDEAKDVGVVGVGTGQNYASGEVVTGRDDYIIGTIGSDETYDKTFKGKLQEVLFYTSLTDDRATIYSEIQDRLSKDLDFLAPVSTFFPTYGAQMSFQAENSSWKGSSFYQFISPRGLNNLRLKSKLSFVNNLTQTKKLLNYIESITTGDITGEQAFTGDISYLNFGVSKNGTKISFDTDYYKNFSGSQIIDYTVVDLSDDVYKVDVSLFNNTVSPVLSNGMAFVSDKTSAISDGNFSKFDVATGSTTDCNPTVFDNYFYLTADRVNSISASNISGVSTYTGVADDSTRTFFWEPDRSVPLAVNHANRTEFFKNSFVKTLNISENQNSLNQIELTFTNRSQKETYSMLHFLESHLGYKHFVYYHDNDVINKNKVFYCPRWDHTLVYKDSNNIKATFVEIVAPTIPV